MFTPITKRHFSYLIKGATFFGIVDRAEVYVTLSGEAIAMRSAVQGINYEGEFDYFLLNGDYQEEIPYARVG